jgi:hypothetical protein
VTDGSGRSTTVEHDVVVTSASSTTPPPSSPPAAKVPPTNTSLPTVAGAAQVGDTLTASPGTWSGDTPMSYSYRWSDGTTGQTDRLSSGDVGQSITVTVTVSNDGGSATATSAPAGPVAAPPPALSVPQNTAVPSISGTPQSGDTLTASPGTWTSDGSPVTFAYAWSDGRTGRTDALTAADVGQTITVTVTATNDGGSSRQTSAPVGPVTTAAPSAPPANSKVGFAAAPTPACSTTVAVNGNVASALANAATGSTVCLASGNWSGIAINQTLSKAVTLASATPGGAVVKGITTNSPVSNLTVEGLSFSDAVKILNSASNDTFNYNTMENWSTSSDAQEDGAFYIFPGDSGGTSSGIVMEYNQIDHVPQCMEDNGNGNSTFSHNVCGPDIGFNSANDVHYVQAEGDNNEIVDNNAFVGPSFSGIAVANSHLNVYHGCGANLEFDNNIVYLSGSIAQSLLWGDDCQTTNSEANNNLFVEASSPDTYSMWIDDAHDSSNVTFSNNTILNSTGYGAMIQEIGSTFHAQGNISGGTAGFGSLANCDCSNNAAADGSGELKWTPAWQSTSWTPNSGSPWNPPPANYYKPSGLASTFGYQGTIGP